jgi:hypothetical protein
VFQPLNAANIFTGDLSGTSNQHSAPMIQGRVTYDYKDPAWSAHVWIGGLTQNLDSINVTGALPGGGFATVNTGQTKTGVAGEAGAVLTVGPFGLTGYYYRAHGVGTTAEFFEALGSNGNARDSEGGYVQGSWKPVPKLKLIGSYGWSSLYLASGEAAYDALLTAEQPIFSTAALDAGDLVRRNESETGGAYYSMTDWLTLVGEYTHTESKSHGPNASSANSVSAGAILFY